MPYGNDGARLRALKANFGTGRAAGAPATVYVALCNAASPGTAIGTEPDATGGYARLAIANEDAAYTFGAAGWSNAGEWRFPAATGTYSTGANALNQWVMYDNAAGGTALAFGALSSTITVTGAGDQPVLPAGSVTATVGA